MKTLLLLLTMLQAFLTLNAQSPWESRPVSGKKFHDIYDEKDFTDRLQSPASNLRDIVQLPLNETDSLYDVYNHVWYYDRDAVHQYYTGNCKDSVITYYVNGILTSRDIIQWDSTGVYKIYNLNQTWNGASWINNMEDQTPVQFGCYIDYNIGRVWNGNSWDTTYGKREVLSFDAYGRISQRLYTSYVNSQWVTSRDVYPHYSGVSDTIIGIDDYHFNTANGQLFYASRDTNYVWISFSSFCNNVYSEYLVQSYDIPTHTWVNSAKEIYNGMQEVGTDTFFNYMNLAWNGASYDSNQVWYYKHDYNGNWVQYHSERYDALTQTWDINYEYKYNYTYGPSNEILRKAYESFDCTPYVDSLTPCYINLYSNFVGCGATSVTVINSMQHNILLSPNPTQSQLTITLSTFVNQVTLRVYDVQGKRIFLTASDMRLATSSIQLSTSTLPDGFYTLQIINNKTGESEVGKFMKQE